MLNFDPHRWIAEHSADDPTLAGLAALAAVRPETENAVSAPEPAKAAKAANPQSVLRTWQNGLNSLDPRVPLHGIAKQRWHNLYDDAVWLAENFAVQAARDGWSTADLFGLWPDKAHYGGLADRLRGSRSLVMTADRACWRSWGRVEQFKRGAYMKLRPFWDSV